MYSVSRCVSDMIFPFRNSGERRHEIESVVTRTRVRMVRTATSKARKPTTTRIRRARDSRFGAGGTHPGRTCGSKPFDQPSQKGLGTFGCISRRRGSGPSRRDSRRLAAVSSFQGSQVMRRTSQVRDRWWSTRGYMTSGGGSTIRASLVASSFSAMRARPRLTPTSASPLMSHAPR
jgi:hypothetical protein